MRKRFGSRLKALFGLKQFDSHFFEELEDVLIEGDLGAKLTFELSDSLKTLAKNQKITDPKALQHLMKERLETTLRVWDEPLVEGKTNIYLILGVNGVGKTTSIAKMATYYKAKGVSVLLAAADTYRAAAIDQLDAHATRTKTRIVKQAHLADPGSVIFDAIKSAQSRSEQLVLADTAGRMHTKESLIRELQKINKVILNTIEDPSCYKKFLVIDATTGQNGLNQAQLFDQAIGLDALILAKYDSMAKGGTLIQIGSQLDLPIAFIGVGENYSDLHRFDKEAFLEALLGIDA
ncbi:MAG: signal recognition particle-docking protein FtsY [Sphaerochaetaceae bacterium]